jgi:hypothetical protein
MDELDKDAFYGIHSYQVAIGDESENYRTYEECDLEMIVGLDGSIRFYDGRDSFLHISPEQISHLKKIVSIAEDVINHSNTTL